MPSVTDSTAPVVGEASAEGAKDQEQKTAERAVPDAERILTLEQKYIALLEKRIKELEEKLQTGGSASEDRVKDCRKQDEEKKNGDKKEDKDDDENENKEGGKDNSSDEDARVRYVLSKWDGVQCRRISTDVSKVDKKENNPKKHAFILRKTMTEQNTFSYSEVEIQSAELKEFLKANLSHYPGHHWDGDTATMVDPFAPIVHNWDLLQDLAAEAEHKGALSDKEKQVRSDLKLLLNDIETSSGVDRLQAYFKARGKMRANGTITHGDLWTLFYPGRVLIAFPYFDMPQLFIAGPSVFGYPCHCKEACTHSWTAVCWGYDWDGEKYKRKAYEFEMKPFPDTMSIKSLPVYPLAFYSGDKDVLMKMLLKRGAEFRKLAEADRGKQMFTYQGKAMYQDPGVSTIDAETQVTQAHIANDDFPWITACTGPLLKATQRKPTKLPTCDLKPGSVMVDFGSYFRYADKCARLGELKPSVTAGDGECNCPTCTENEKLNARLKFHYDRVKAHAPFEDFQLQMCPPRVLGYIIEQKMWAQLAVDNIKPPHRDAQDVFNKKLQLDEDTKALIRSLVLNHEAGKELKGGKRVHGIEDIVQGKGEGLVILLYGPPGVGKTLTAESIALRANKPLFSVGVTDIGVDPEKVQVNLERVFDLAGVWEAVLLIDEADVFLDTRNARPGAPPDIRRNAMVSVLLRILEYYQGILILTTNRVRDFDVAVQSRIHLPIRYEDLSGPQQEAIFMNFLEQADQRNLVTDLQRVREWVHDEFGTTSGPRLNGRQIRNLVSSALGLSREAGEKLDKNHLRQVTRKALDFMQHTKEADTLYRGMHVDRF